MSKIWQNRIFPKMSKIQHNASIQKMDQISFTVEFSNSDGSQEKHEFTDFQEVVDLIENLKGTGAGRVRVQIIKPTEININGAIGAFHHGQFDARADRFAEASGDTVKKSTLYEGKEYEWAYEMGLSSKK